MAHKAKLDLWYKATNGQRVHVTKEMYDCSLDLVIGRNKVNIVQFEDCFYIYDTYKGEVKLAKKIDHDGNIGKIPGT